MAAVDAVKDVAQFKKGETGFVTKINKLVKAVKGLAEEIDQHAAEDEVRISALEAELKELKDQLNG